MIITSLLMGCKIGTDCTVVDDMPEFDNLVNVEGIQVEDIRFNADEIIEDENLLAIGLILNSDSLYKKWEAAAQDCEECKFPEIDFNNRTLIGKYYQIQCLDIPVLSITKENNTYTYYNKSVNNSECLVQTCPNYTFGWVSIPKIDENAIVEFKKGELYKDCDC